MAKVKMACPISGGACIECAIYRGRHYYLCFAPRYHGRASGAEGASVCTEDRHSAADTTFGMPEMIELGSRVLKNVEEIVERREL